MAGRRRSILALCLLTSWFVPTFSASGSETVNYAYDARGRLVKVSRSGDVNSGDSACYEYDPADNRKNVTVLLNASCVVSNGGGGGGSVSFSVNDVTLTEGGTLQFTVTKSGANSSSVSVGYAVAAGTATLNSDYDSAAQALSGTLSFASSQGAATQVVLVHTIDDALVEGVTPETVFLNLTNPVGGSISDSQGKGSITDNDTSACGGVSFKISSDGNVIEGGTETLTVTKTGTTSNSCDVYYSTANGSAVSGSDYIAIPSTKLTFTSAQSQQSVSVFTVENAVIENSETFTVSLSNPSGGATLGSPSSVTVTIGDDDAEPPPEQCYENGIPVPCP